jgi:putative ABC transport system ATP-binding protein
MNSPVFETQQLIFNNSIHYPDIKILENRTTFVTGKSGSGKTTLLRLFNGTVSPSSGEIRYFGKNINDMDFISLRKEVLLVSQSVFLFDASIKENFRQFYEYRDKPVPFDDAITDFLNICCIPFSLDKDCSVMSGGERQRIFTAIYLSLLPKVLMLDEPTSALDITNSSNVISNILGFCKEKNITSVIVSHDNKITDEFADDIVNIEGKNIV